MPFITQQVLTTPTAKAVGVVGFKEIKDQMKNTASEISITSRPNEVQEK